MALRLRRHCHPAENIATKWVPPKCGCACVALLSGVSSDGTRKAAKEVAPPAAAWVFLSAVASLMLRIITVYMDAREAS